MSTWQLVLTDAVILIGLIGMTVGIVGVVRAADTYVALHAGALVVVFTAGTMVAVACLQWNLALTARALLVAALMLVTTPVSTHALARLEWRRTQQKSERAPQ